MVSGHVPASLTLSPHAGMPPTRNPQNRKGDNRTIRDFERETDHIHVTFIPNIVIISITSCCSSLTVPDLINCTLS